MFQFYLLSVLLNTLAGLVLISLGKGKSTNLILAEEKAESIDELNENDSKKKKKASIKNMENKISSSEIFTNKTFRLVVGILAFIVGLFKLFVVVKSGVIIFADFFPAVFGLVSGFSILLNLYFSKSSIEFIPEVLNVLFIKNVTILGFCTIIIAALHFIFPEALFI
ncbi:MAG: hypothetical protein MJ174_06080 [Treponema sp.]|nr:hypothetical protein [Treponema sp.]